MSVRTDLMSMLTDATARVDKRSARKRGSKGESAGARAIRERRREVEAERQRAEWRERERREESAYRRRTGRLKTIGERRTAARRALAEVGTDCTPFGRAARLANYLRTLDAHTERVFALPILPSEVMEGGRFHRRALWLGMEVGMTAADEIDIVGEAVALCYLKGQTAEDEHGRLMPTLGAMYRNMKIAYHSELDKFRQHKRHGVHAVYSLDAAAEGLGTDWLDANASRLEWLGYGLADAAEYPAAMVPASNLAASRRTLAMAQRQRERDAWRADYERAERDALAARAPIPNTVNDADDRRAWHADRVAIRVLINGGTLADVAAATGVSVATVTERLLALEGTLGATIHSTAGSEPVHSTLDHSSDAVKYRHEGKGWTGSGVNGCRASEVVVSHR